MPYEDWVLAFGETCGICGAGPSANRRLDRDHIHTGPRAGEARGLLCHRCNRALPAWMIPAWLFRAAAYLDRPVELEPDGSNVVGLDEYRTSA